jgi:hypothetical protein
VGPYKSPSSSGQAKDNTVAAFSLINPVVVQKWLDEQAVWWSWQGQYWIEDVPKQWSNEWVQGR